MGCGCGNKGSQTVTRYRVIHQGKPKDFATKPEADTFRANNGVTAPVMVVKVPKT